MRTFAVLADDPTTVKIKTAESFKSPVGTNLAQLCHKNKTVNFFLEPLVAFLQKFAPVKIPHCMVLSLCMVIMMEQL